MENEHQHQRQQQDIKKTIHKTYSKIALQQSNSGSDSSSSPCCALGCCSGEGGTDSLAQVAAIIGYDTNELEFIPQASILGVGCGAPVNFADLQKGETVVDLGSGTGIDVFLSAKKVTDIGKVIGIDMTDEMLERARRNAKEHGFINVDAFKEIYRILKPDGGRMVISDLATDTEIAPTDADAQMGSSCIDGALIKEHYIDSIRQTGFQNIEVLNEQLYMDEEANQTDGKRKRKITSLVIKAVKK
jgi:SAM-dependent methyltransferase